MLANSADFSAVVDQVLKAGVIPILLEAMSSEVADSELMQSVEAFVSNLALHERAKHAIGESAAISIFIGSMRTCTELEIAQAACSALKHLAMECSENQARIFEEGGLAAVFYAINAFPNDPVIRIAGFGLLKELAINSDVAYATGIVEGGGLPIILSAMTKYSDLAMMQVAACDVIAYLPYEKRDRMAPKIAASIISALENHPDAVDVQLAGCEALLEIATHVPGARKLVKHGKTVQLLQNAKELDERCASDVDDILAL